MKAISVLYVCSEEYSQHAGISLLSLFNHNANLPITVYIAGVGLSSRSVALLTATCKEYTERLFFLNTDKALSEIKKMDCKTWNGSYATWLRFFVLSQIPSTVDYVLNIDADTLVLGDISDVFEIDMDGCPVAAVCDALGMYHRYSLEFSKEEPYYNGGILLFNLKEWRANNTVNLMMEHLSENASKYEVFDQDLLNDFFCKKIKKLPQKYNVQGVLYAYSPEQYFRVYSEWREDSYYTKEETVTALNNPIILHFFRFMGDYPWHEGFNLHPCKKIYEVWKAKSLWKDTARMHNRFNLLFFLEKILYYIMPRLIFLYLFTFVSNRILIKRTRK